MPDQHIPQCHVMFSPGRGASILVASQESAYGAFDFVDVLIALNSQGTDVVPIIIVLFHDNNICMDGCMNG